MIPPALAFSAPARQSAILIVDDAPDSLGLLQGIMRQQGYQTFVANTGKRALDIAARVQPDLILLDVLLPDLDGLEICRRLKRQPDTAHIPVIFISACGETEDIVAGFDTGAVDYISKPVRLAEVCARVSAHLRFRNNSVSQKQQTDRLQMILDGMEEGLMLVNGDGRIVYANPASERFAAWSIRELAGMALADLLAETGADGAASLAEAIRAHVERLAIPNPRSTTSEMVTVSVGVATIVPTLFDDLRSYFIVADRAMYEAKSAGRNRVVSVCAGAAWDTVREAVAH